MLFVGFFFFFCLRRRHLFAYASEANANLAVVRAFSTIVADTQFSALGIVLLTALSRLTKATGIDYKDLKYQRPPAKRLVKKEQDNDNTELKEDFGQVVHRREAGSIPGASLPDNAKAKVKAPETKKRKKNAIDDLFEGLV